MLTLRGQAQDAGALGDTIGVLNVQSKRVVQGVITGPGRVQILGAATRVVENAPQQPAQSESRASPRRIRRKSSAGAPPSSE